MEMNAPVFPKILDTPAQRGALLGIDAKPEDLPSSIRGFLEEGIVGDVNAFFQYLESHVHLDVIRRLQARYSHLVPVISEEGISSGEFEMPADGIRFHFTFQGSAASFAEIARELAGKSIVSLHIAMTTGTSEQPARYLAACAGLTYAELAVSHASRSTDRAAHVKKVIDFLTCVGNDKRLRRLALYSPSFEVLDDTHVSAALHALLPRLSRLDLQMREPDLDRAIALLTAKDHTLEWLGLTLNSGPRGRFEPSATWDAAWQGRFKDLSRSKTLKQLGLPRKTRERLGIEEALGLLYDNLTLLDISYCEVDPPKTDGECVLLACIDRNRQRVLHDHGLTPAAQTVARLVFSGVTRTTERDAATVLGEHVKTVAREDTKTRNALARLVSPKMQALLRPPNAGTQWTTLVEDHGFEQVVTGAVRWAIDRKPCEATALLFAGLDRLARLLGDTVHADDHPKILERLAEALRQTMRQIDPAQPQVTTPPLDPKTTPACVIATQRCLETGLPPEDADVAPPDGESGAMALFATPCLIVDEILSGAGEYLRQELSSEDEKRQVFAYIAKLKARLCETTLLPWLQAAYRQVMGLPEPDATA